MTITFPFSPLHIFHIQYIVPVSHIEAGKTNKNLAGLWLKTLSSEETNRPNNKIMLPFHFSIFLYIGENIIIIGECNSSGVLTFLDITLLYVNNTDQYS